MTGHDIHGAALMAQFDDWRSYAHENRKFIIFRLIAPFIVVSLFLCAFLYGLAWQSKAGACAGGQLPCHAVGARQNPGP
jgi:hypothetical protein